jgi:hypothetical protein
MKRVVRLVNAGVYYVCVGIVWILRKLTPRSK